MAVVGVQVLLEVLVAHLVEVLEFAEIISLLLKSVVCKMNEFVAQII